MSIHFLRHAIQLVENVVAASVESVSSLWADNFRICGAETKNSTYYLYFAQRMYEVDDVFTIMFVALEPAVRSENIQFCFKKNDILHLRLSNLWPFWRKSALPSACCFQEVWALVVD